MPEVSFNGSLRKFFEKIIMKNEHFLREKYVDVLLSSFDFVIDVLNIIEHISPGRPVHRREQNKVVSEVVLKYLVYPVLIHIVLPSVHFLPTLILLGAIPHVYYTLRLILEATVIAVYADCKEELAGLSVFEKIEHPSVRNATVFGIKDSLKKVLIDRLGPEKGERLVSIVLNLYQELSAWVHPIARIRFESKEFAAGVIKVVLMSAMWRDYPPIYGYLMPGVYTDEDLRDLKQLNEAILHTRVVVPMLIYVWSIDKSWINVEALRGFLRDII